MVYWAQLDLVRVRGRVIRIHEYRHQHGLVKPVESDALALAWAEAFVKERKEEEEKINNLEMERRLQPIPEGARFTLRRHPLRQTGK